MGEVGRGPCNTLAVFLSYWHTVSTSPQARFTLVSHKVAVTYFLREAKVLMRSLWPPSLGCLEAGRTQSRRVTWSVAKPPALPFSLML